MAIIKTILLYNFTYIVCLIAYIIFRRYIKKSNIDLKIAFYTMEKSAFYIAIWYPIYVYSNNSIDIPLIMMIGIYTTTGIVNYVFEKLYCCDK